MYVRLYFDQETNGQIYHIYVGTLFDCELEYMGDSVAACREYAVYKSGQIVGTIYGAWRKKTNQFFLNYGKATAEEWKLEEKEENEKRSKKYA